MDMYDLDSLSRFVRLGCARRESAGKSICGGAPLADQEVDIDPLWEELEQIHRDGSTVRCLCTGWNQGGLLVRWKELQGFVPASQLCEVPVFHGDKSRDEILARWVGEELELVIIELDSGRNRLVFSERATQWAPKEGERLLEAISPGDVCEGSVSNLCDFGAFVDLGGVDGLIHISELSWGRVSHPSDMLDIGDRVRVYVISVDPDKERIALSLKRLRENPWSSVEEYYAPGDIVEATVTNLVAFGAFAQIEEGLEGLVHISELASERVHHPSQVLSVGDKVLVRILDIDSDNHRLSLSTKQAPKKLDAGDIRERHPGDGGAQDLDANPTFLY